MVSPQAVDHIQSLESCTGLPIFGIVRKQYSFSGKSLALLALNRTDLYQPVSTDVCEAAAGGAISLRSVVSHNAAARTFLAGNSYFAREEAIDRAHRRLSSADMLIRHVSAGTDYVHFSAQWVLETYKR